MLRREVELYRPDPPDQPPRPEFVPATGHSPEKSRPHRSGYYSAQFWRHASGLELLRYSPDLNSGEYVYVTIAPKRVPYTGDPGADLVLSAKEGDQRELTQFLALGASTAVRDADGNTPLITAALHNHLKIIRTLITWKADPNAVNNEGFSALIHAASWGNSAMVVLLLQDGALVNIQDKNGVSALHFAALNRSVETIEDRTGRTELHFLGPGHAAEIINMLLESGANIDAQDRDGETPLMYGAKRADADVVKVLLAHGANSTIKNRDGKTALDIVRACPACSHLLPLLSVKKSR